MNAITYTCIIESPSAISGDCLLGEGKSEREAWEDAFGPKPWTSFTKNCARRAWCRKVDDAELEKLHEARANRGWS